MQASWTKANGGEPIFRHGPPGAPDSTKVDHPAVVRFDGRFHMWFTMGGEDSSYTIGYAITARGKRPRCIRAAMHPG